MNRRYQRTAKTITSGGNRKPTNADGGGDQDRTRDSDLTGFSLRQALALDGKLPGEKAYAEFLDLILQPDN